MNFLTQTFYGNTVLDYTIAIATFLLIFFLFNPIIKFLLSIGEKVALRTNTNVDDKLIGYFRNKKNKALISLEIVIAFFASAATLAIEPSVSNIINKVAVVLITLFVTSVLLDFIKYFIKAKYTQSDDPRANSLYILLPVIRIVVWVLAIFFILSNLGYNVSTLLTGLGIGGVAIALASQSFLGDLISFISIISDKPFEIGDYVAIGGIEGTIKRIGIKSVRIERNLGEEVVLPNSKITNSELYNYKRMAQRRCDIVVGLVMDTPNDKLQQIPQIVQSICDENDNLQFVRCHFSNISDFAYQFSIVCFVNSSDYLIWATARQFLLYRIRDEFDKTGISMAYPTYEIKKIIN